MPQRPVSKGRVRALGIVIGDPRGDRCAGMDEALEQALVQQLVAHATVETLDERILHRLFGRDEVPCNPARRGASTAFEVNSVPWSETISPGLPRRAINVVSSRATRAPEIDVSAMLAKHSRVTSSTTLKMRKRRPLLIWSCTKSTDQRALARASIRIGARVPAARRRARRLRTLKPSSR